MALTLSNHDFFSPVTPVRASFSSDNPCDVIDDNLELFSPDRIERIIIRQSNLQREMNIYPYLAQDCCCCQDSRNLSKQQHVVFFFFVAFNTPFSKSATPTVDVLKVIHRMHELTVITTVCIFGQ